MAKPKLTKEEWEILAKGLEERLRDGKREYTEREREVRRKLDGTPGERQAEEEAFHARRLKIESMYGELVQKYPGQWVVLHNDGALFVAGTHQEVLDWSDEQGYDRDDIWTEYLRPEDEKYVSIPSAWILSEYTPGGE